MKTIKYSIMTKLIYALVIVAASVSLISCSSDEPEGSKEDKKSEAFEEYPDFFPFYLYQGSVFMKEGDHETGQLKYSVFQLSSCPKLTGYDIAIPTGITASTVEIKGTYPLTKVTYTINGEAYEEELTGKDDVALSYKDAAGQTIVFMKLLGVQNNDLVVEIAGNDKIYGIVSNIRICFDGLPSNVAIDGQHFYENKFTDEYMVPELNDVAYRIYPGKFAVNWRPIFVHGLRVAGDDEIGY